MIVQKAIIKKGDKFLVVLRAPDAKYFPGHWDFPGGKLEANEDSFIGIEREAIEEVGLKIKAKEVVGTYEMDLDNNGEKVSHRFIVYSTEILSGDVKLSHEHLEYRWATKEEILRLPIEPYMTSYFNEHK